MICPLNLDDVTIEFSTKEISTGSTTSNCTPLKGFEISIPTSRKEVLIDLYTASSQLISKRIYPVLNEKVHLNLEKESLGVYFVKIYLDTPVTLTIIKN